MTKVNDFADRQIRNYLPESSITELHIVLALTKKPDKDDPIEFICIETRFKYFT